MVGQCSRATLGQPHASLHTLGSRSAGGRVTIYTTIYITFISHSLQVAEGVTINGLTVAAHDPSNGVVCFDDSSVATGRDLFCAPFSVSSTTLTVDSASVQERAHQPLLTTV